MLILAQTIANVETVDDLAATDYPLGEAATGIRLIDTYRAGHLLKMN